MVNEPLEHPFANVIVGGLIAYRLKIPIAGEID
jgi:hypothetical protein